MKKAERGRPPVRLSKPLRRSTRIRGKASAEPLPLLEDHEQAPPKRWIEIRSKQQMKAKGDTLECMKQPTRGSVSRTTGRVCWRFAGGLFFGILVPKRETVTHCYAR